MRNLVYSIDPFDRAATLAAVRERLFGQSTESPKLARFRLEHQLGRGGAGVVYKAHDPELDRAVAIKFVHHAGVNRDGSGQERLRAEAQALARVRHPNVVTIHDIGWYASDSELGLALSGAVDAKVPERGIYLVMEYVEGKTLRAWIQEDAPSRREVLRVLADAGRGLAAVHEAGLVHRDFKPTNVIVDDDRVCVLDFGLAGLSTVTSSSRITGTPAYMSPEQHLGAPTDARTDQFAFCVTAFEALTGVRPYPGPDLADYHRQKTDGPPTPTGAVRPRRLRSALRRGLSPYPNHRFATMKGLLQALLPSPKRHLVAASVGAAAIVAASGLTAALQTDIDPQRHCEHQANRIDDAWSSHRAQRLEPVARATLDASTWLRFRDDLDDWVARWKLDDRAACLASDEATVRTRICLEEQRLALAGVLDVLREGDPQTLLRARELTASVFPPDACSAALGRGRLPQSGEARLLALRIRKRFSA